MSVVVHLRSGWRRDGHTDWRAAVKAPTGRDEMMLEDPTVTPAEWANRLLAACVIDTGANTPIGLAAVRGLSLGDRERLLVALYAVTFGRAADLLFHCNGPGCGEAAELTLDLAALLTDPGPPADPDAPVTVAVGGSAASMTYRLPTAGDLEAIAPLAAADPDAAADELIGRLIVSMAPEAQDRLADPTVLEAPDNALAAEIARRDPDAAILISVACPACGTVGEALLDAGTLVRARLAAGEGICAEVDRLARTYHWSEADILALPHTRRQRYLALVAQAEAAR